MIFFSGACGIEVDDKFVVTGGQHTHSRTKVAEYTETGAVTYMPDLKNGRWFHACSKFVNDDGVTVSIICVKYRVTTIN